ncbi:MAG: class II D-tagatose-bisphosphate aldolase, non-catalytic subunit [Anaerolineales bacterium]|nr:class II D-tagatose-bisphosphate aldolase, non-catalytic subunit [Anaerolineales bacterium]MCX7609948.1 class II D-tagatose-bisphosphate aldolase, non-catalytic subunit [Anaerolineales bacterium]MDW8226558.1 class II D-tagatose-bisphosphate aldolase, non-catalytic subunit [Anaerolineales bacterium]
MFSKSMHYLDFLAFAHHYKLPLGLPSVCSAHPLVIETALRHGLRHPQPVLIEATSNQVNPFGGYTGMTPADFAQFVREKAESIGFPPERLILGGDHLGPLPWAHEPTESAMQKAADLLRAAVQAGFTKLHLDCSMPLGEESPPSVETIAQRIAFLAKVAEETAQTSGLSSQGLRYVIGSEVPPAGGTKAGHTEVQVTTPESAAETLEVTRRAFYAQGLEAAWERVRALVVQPGVEFGDDVIHAYPREQARPLSRFIENVPGIVYEAHSTDYQSAEALRALVEDHFAILKVGPALTFALREAIFALEAIERELYPPEERSHLSEALETVMLQSPSAWQKYYTGNPEEQRLKRRFGLSDRIRYYWPRPEVQAALERLRWNLESRSIPLSLLHQYFAVGGALEESQLVAGQVDKLLRYKIMLVLETYLQAAWPLETPPPVSTVLDF